MKEIPFRWIDKYLIHLKIQEKFYLLFFLPIIALLVLTFVLDSAADQMLNHLYQDELVLMKGLIESANLTQNQVASLLANSETISIGAGEGAISVNNGAFSLVGRPKSKLMVCPILNAHCHHSSDIVSYRLWCVLHYDLYRWRNVHHE